VALGYRGGHNGAASDSSDNMITVGATYLIAQNVEFQVNQIFYTRDAYDPKPATGGDSLTTLMICVFLWLSRAIGQSFHPYLLAFFLHNNALILTISM
jgi:hypothetical protein